VLAAVEAICDEGFCLLGVFRDHRRGGATRDRERSHPEDARRQRGRRRVRAGLAGQHVEHGFDAQESTVGVLAAEAPQIVADTRSRSAPDLVGSIVRSIEVVAHHKAVGLGDTALVFSPEHVKTLAEGLSDEALAEIPGGVGSEAPGWPFRNAPSRPVFRRITPAADVGPRRR
jgi:hypothetical protein